VRAHELGSALVLGLRDVLDEPRIVAAELAGAGWREVPELFSEVLVYGGRHFVDHEAEYGLPVRPRYCGWVVPDAPPLRQRQWSLAVAAGGGGDGGPVFDLGAALLGGRPGWSGVLAAGPYADRRSVALASRALGGRLTVVEAATGCETLFSRAGAVLCMAGYNSTLEALAAGQRPILVPRRSPRREQAIRAWRLGALGLADVVDEGAAAAEVDWLLGRSRLLEPGAVAAARPAAGEAVHLHGDVHPRNLLVDGGRLALIDLDQAGAGQPAADLGSVLARLRQDRWLGVVDPGRAAELGAGFLAAYAAAAPLPAAAPLRWHTAAALLAERALRAVNRVIASALPHLEAPLAEATELVARTGDDPMEVCR
jgi:hypothetical protein